MTRQNIHPFSANKLRRTLLLAGLAPLLGNAEPTKAPSPLPPGLPSEAILIQTDGAWSWFNDHTTRFVGGDLYIGYVKNKAGKMAMTRYDFDTATAYEFLLGTQPSKDDHDVPTVTVLPDGKILSTYSRHNIEQVFYHRTSLNSSPTSLADWGPEKSRDAGAKNTYCNTFRLTSESNKIYNFTRAIGFNPTYFTSTDNGRTWSDSIRLIHAKNIKGGNTRPYVRYASNHKDRIDLIYTDNHARAELENGVKNSVYHLYIQNGEVNHTNGDLIKPLADAPLEHFVGDRGTVIYQQSDTPWKDGDGPDDWIPGAAAWIWDVQYQSDGKPVCVFQAQVDGVSGPEADFKSDRIYYYYARWDGNRWKKKFIAHAGRGIYSREDDYGGGMTIDPEHPGVVYISSNSANPFDLALTNIALNANNERYEIYRGVTTDGGETWKWEAVTSGSASDNLRPFVPEGHGRSRALVWFRGTYTTYLDYDCDVYGYFIAR